MYYVFNALENGTTDAERAFAVFGYLVSHPVVILSSRCRNFSRCFPFDAHVCSLVGHSVPTSWHAVVLSCIVSLVFAHIWLALLQVMVIIDGAVAGVLSSVMISMGGKDRIVNEKLAAAKTWMQEHRINKAQQLKTLNYFRHVYKSHVMYQENDILNTMPPSMRLDFSTHLYATHLAQIPLFRGLGVSLIHGLCGVVEPMMAVRDQVIYTEGSIGKEMYMLLSGELEITCVGERLGFLSDGSFFGETPLLDSSAEAEVRRRTVTAMTDCKLCFITRDALEPLKLKYPELALKLKRCARFNRKQAVNKKGRKFKEALHEARTPDTRTPAGVMALMSNSGKERAEIAFGSPGASPPQSPKAAGSSSGERIVPLAGMLQPIVGAGDASAVVA